MRDRFGASRRRTTSGPSPGTSTATSSGSGPRSSRRGIRTTTSSSTSPGASSRSSRSGRRAGPVTSRPSSSAEASTSLASRRPASPPSTPSARRSTAIEQPRRSPRTRIEASVTQQSSALPSTLGELRASGWRSRTVKEELRSNLIARLGEGRPIFPGVVGFNDTVLPAVENAILAGQDLVFLGERGQAKTRMARLLVGLLDESIPVVRGGGVDDDPYAPISPAAEAIVDEPGGATPVHRLPRAP